LAESEQERQHFTFIFTVRSEQEFSKNCKICEHFYEIRRKENESVYLICKYESNDSLWEKVSQIEKSKRRLVGSLLYESRKRKANKALIESLKREIQAKDDESAKIRERIKNNYRCPHRPA